MIEFNQNRVVLFSHAHKLHILVCVQLVFLVAAQPTKPITWTASWKWTTHETHVSSLSIGKMNAAACIAAWPNHVEIQAAGTSCKRPTRGRSVTASDRDCVNRDCV